MACTAPVLRARQTHGPHVRALSSTLTCSSQLSPPLDAAAISRPQPWLSRPAVPLLAPLLRQQALQPSPNVRELVTAETRVACQCRRRLHPSVRISAAATRRRCRRRRGARCCRRRLRRRRHHTALRGRARRRRERGGDGCGCGGGGAVIWVGFQYGELALAQAQASLPIGDANVEVGWDEQRAARLQAARVGLWGGWWETGVRVCGV